VLVAKLKSKPKIVKKEKKKAKPQEEPTTPAQEPEVFDLSVFYDDYIPKRLVVRDEQVKKITDAINQFITARYSDNLLLQGVTGSGKTSTLQHVLNKFDKKLWVFISCKENRNLKGILGEIGDIKPTTRETASDLLPDVIDNLKKHRKIIALDDITSGSSWVELLDYLNAIFRKTQIPIIITSNLFTILDKMPTDARRTLLFKRVDFPAYNATELREIIKDRLQSINAKLPDGTVNIIAALVAKDDASARTGLDLTRMALTRHRTTEEEVRKLKAEIEKQSYYDYLTKLSPKERDVLSYIIRKFVETKKPVTARELSSILMLSQARTAQVITDLENYGVVTTKMFFGGRREGNFRIVQPEDFLITMLNTGSQEEVRRLLSSTA